MVFVSASHDLLYQTVSRSWNTKQILIHFYNTNCTIYECSSIRYTAINNSTYKHIKINLDRVVCLHCFFGLNNKTCSGKKGAALAHSDFTNNTWCAKKGASTGFDLLLRFGVSWQIFHRAWHFGTHCDSSTCTLYGALCTPSHLFLFFFAWVHVCVSD